MRTRIVLLILLAAAVRLYGIQTQSLWFDEGWSAYAAAQPNIIAAFNADLTNPPLYYVLLNLHAGLIGNSEFSLRLFSLFMGLLTIPLSYQLGKRAAGESAGWYAALLVTFSAQMWWASQEARMYTLLAVLILMAALAWERLLKRPSRGAWIALAMAELLLLYGHNTGVVAALWLNLVTVIAWLVRRNVNRPHWRGWIISQVIVGLMWLPYFVTRFLNLTEANAAVTSAPSLDLSSLFVTWASLLVAPFSILGDPLNTDANLPPFALLLLVTVITLLFIRRRAGWLWLHVIVLSAGLIAALIVLGNNFHGRYTVMIAPLLFTALGVGIARSPRSLRWIPVVGFTAIFVLAWQMGQDPLYGHDDARGMVQNYADYLTANDTVLAWSYADRYELAYYWDRLGVTARRVTLPEGADLDQVLPLLPTSGDIALNVWYTQRADYRGMMDCILQHGTLTPPELFTTYGMTNNLYRSPVPLSPDFVPLGNVFTDSAGTPIVRVDTVGALAVLDAAAGGCIPVQITLLSSVAHQLRAALIVQNDLGMEIASDDVPFATANQRTSEVLAPGDTLTAYPLIRLPYGTPPGAYRVYLRVYDAANVSGLTPPADQPSSGRDLLLGVWDAPSATWDESLAPVNVNRAPVLLDADPRHVANGEAIRLTILWLVPPQTLILSGDRWSIEIEPDGDEYPLRDWRVIRIPTVAGSGRATLELPDGTVLETFEIEARPMITEAPAFDHPLNVEFPGVGELIGYSVNTPPYTHENPPHLTLIWQAGEGEITTDYTVFAQLINDGVIAQSDHAPGERATSSWRAGEYVIDEHTLTFNVDPRDGVLYVGLYDARTNTRVILTDGSDAVRLEAQD